MNRWPHPFRKALPILAMPKGNLHGPI
jgi:hypothetical protein